MLYILGEYRKWGLALGSIIFLSTIVLVRAILYYPYTGYVEDALISTTISNLFIYLILNKGRMNSVLLLNFVLGCVVYVAFLLYGMELSARIKFRFYKEDYIQHTIGTPDKSVLLATLSEATSGPTGTSVFYEIVYDPNSEMVEPDKNRLDRCEYDSQRLEENFFYVVKTC